MMSSKESTTWIRKFSVTETRKHSKGFTIYKITSNIFPIHSPDASTSITVWKRFNEIYKLYQLLKSRHNSLGVRDHFPSLTRGGYFNRFDTEVIESRKKDILEFLTYVSTNTSLFTAQCFVQFFETTQIPNENECGNIAVIRCSLSLPKEDDLLSIKSIRNESDVDSACSSTSLSECSNIFCGEPENLDKSCEPYIETITKNECEKKEQTDNPVSEYTSRNTDDSESKLLEENLLQLSLKNKGGSDYIFEAAYHFSKAVQCEDSKHYSIAAELYKVGISCLETGIHSDPDLDRCSLITSKLNKYKEHENVLRSLIANDSEDVKNVSSTFDNEVIANSNFGDKITQEHSHSTKCAYKSKLGNFERPLEELHNFHVLRIVNTVLQVSDTRTKDLCIIKTTQKILRNDIFVENIFPHNVPFMVPLINYFQSETSIYLLLKYVSGGKLCDRIHNFIVTNAFCKSENTQIDINCILMEPQTMKTASKKDAIFSDFLVNYNKKGTKSNELNMESGDGFGNNNNTNKKRVLEYEEAITDLNTEKLLHNSARLLKSISETLLSDEKRNISPDMCNMLKLSKEASHINVNDNAQVNNKFESGDSWLINEDQSLQLTNIEKRNIIPQSLLAEWAAELLIAIEHLHYWGVICGPIYPNDLLLGEKGQLVLTYRSSLGFNLQRYRLQDSNKLIAPELVNPLVRQTEIHDWWYYGAALYQLFLGIPLQKLHPHGFTNFTILQVPPHISNEASSLLIALLQGDESERLGCGQTGVNEIKSHPFFIKIDWHKLQQSFTYLN